MKKNKSLIKTEKKLTTVKDEIDGYVSINGRELIKDKDFFLLKEGIELTEESKKKLKNKDTKSYCFSFSRKIIRELK